MKISKSGLELDYDVDLTGAYPSLVRDGVRDGVLTAYEAGGATFLRPAVSIRGQSDTLSIAPFFLPDSDVVLTPFMVAAYQATAIPQDRYDAMLARQMALQASIMAIECLASVLALFCTYWPMKRFLDSLETAFNVPSVSHEKRQRMAAAMMTETTKPSRQQWYSGATLPSANDSVRRSL